MDKKCRVSLEELAHDRNSSDIDIDDIKLCVSNPELLVEVYEHGMREDTAKALALALLAEADIGLLFQVMLDIENYLFDTGEYETWLNS